MNLMRSPDFDIFAQAAFLTKIPPHREIIDAWFAWHLVGDEMKESLKPGIRHKQTFKVPASKTVPALYPESDEFAAMPEVFATGFLVGFLEWTCIVAINPHLDWPKEQTVGTHIDVSHEAATPAGFEVTANVELIKVEGRKLTFSVEAHDGIDLISRGLHERFVIDKEKFEGKIATKARAAITNKRET